MTLSIFHIVTTFKEKTALVLIFSDITEHKLVAVLQENNDYKNRLLASVTHELRTPLNASINFTQAAIEAHDLPAKIGEQFLLPALRSNQLLLHLINDILDFSQISANKFRLTYETLDITKTLDECLSLIKIQADRKGLVLSSDYQFEGAISNFCTDHNRLRQIVLNLLSNALKFTITGGIKLRAKILTVEEVASAAAAIISSESKTGEEKLKKVEIDGEKTPSEILYFKKERSKKARSILLNFRRVLHVEVSDTGIGIPAEDQKRLFRFFEKIELGKFSSLNKEGVGLGLAIV